MTTSSKVIGPSAFVLNWGMQIPSVAAEIANKQKVDGRLGQV